MIDIIKKSFVSIASARLIRTSIICLLISALILGVFVALANFAASNTELASWGWVDKILDYLLNAGAVFIAWFLFPIVTPVIASFFAEKVVREIEKKDYQGLLQNTSNNKILTVFFEALKFALIMLFLNIICLPFYLIPVVNVVVYYLLNSYLISREFFEMAASCYYNHSEVKQIRKSNRMMIMGFGFLIVVINNVPVLNLFGPIIAITLMAHLFFKLYKKTLVEN